MTITDEYVSLFKEDSDYRGFFAAMAAENELPIAVDSNDPRVKEIISRCKREQLITAERADELIAAAKEKANA